MVAATFTASEAGLFLRSLFGNIDTDYRIEVRSLSNDETVPPYRGFVFVGNPEPSGNLLDGTNWFYSVAAKATGPGKPALGGFVFADLDSVSPSFDPAHIKPVLTEAVSSGHGYHLYWRLDRQVLIDDAIRLASIASLAFDGDKKVNEAQRMLRLPGTINAKAGKAPVPCVRAFSSPIEYDPSDLEEWLIAAVIARTWTEARHYMALGAAATLNRAEWPLEAAERIIENVCTITGDEERADRIRAVQDTYRRAEAGEKVSAEDFRNALTESLPHGTKDSPFGDFLSALGVQGKDGDVTLDGVPIGTRYTLEQDIFNHLLESGEWAVSGGMPMLWNGKHWERKTKEQLVTSVFRFLERLQVVITDLEMPMPAHIKLARTVADLMIGGLPELHEPDSRYLPVSNGALDIDSGLLVAHDKKHRARWVLPVEFDSTASCDEWMRFLWEAAPATIGYLQEWFGYCLLAENPEQLMLWLHGPSGTGKSSFVWGIQTVLGEATIAVDPDTLNDYNTASLQSARVALCTEIGNRTLKTSKLKSLVSGDSVAARNPYGKPFTFRFQGKFVWASNSTPPLDQSEGMFRRIAMIPFDHKPKVVDRSLWGKLTNERAGILNWALEGLARVRRYLSDNNWPIPHEVGELVEEYRLDADTYGNFVREEMTPKAAQIVTQREVYARYKWWCDKNGHMPQPNGPIFRKAMRLIGLEDGQEIGVRDSHTGERIPGWRGYDMIERNTF